MDENPYEAPRHAHERREAQSPRAEHKRRRLTSWLAAFVLIPWIIWVLLIINVLIQAIINLSYVAR